MLILYMLTQLKHLSIGTYIDIVNGGPTPTPAIFWPILENTPYPDWQNSVRKLITSYHSNVLIGKRKADNETLKDLVG